MNTPEDETTTPEPSGPCVICGDHITEFDCYGVGRVPGARYHWDCIRAEADTVSPKMPDIHDVPLRDWFAGQIVVGMLANPINNQITKADLAEGACGTSDALIEARKKPRTP